MRCGLSTYMRLHLVINVLVGKRLPPVCRGGLKRFNSIMAGHTEKSAAACRRHEFVPGLPDKSNDVIVCGDVRTSKNHVIFFGGDVQDYPEKMEAHRDNKRYSKWNLENTAQILIRRFPNSAIFVVKPNKMHLNTFSVYSNFVESCNLFGSPTHQHSTRSWNHLETLHKNTVDKELSSSEVCSEENCVKDDNNEVPLKLIGFSKGCIVLNQLLYDLQLAQEDTVTKDFIGRIEEFYWLDGGHSGGRNTWICDSDILQNFSELGKKIIVHVTPYQVRDPMRVWVGKEEKKFVSKLKKFGADITESLHFDDMPASIENHFGLLEEF